MTMKSMTAAAALAVATLFIADAADAQVRMTYAYSENPSAQTAAQAFKALVEGQSNNEIEVNLVIHGALGADRDVVDQLRLGELEFYVPGVHALSAIAPNFQMFDAPYLFADRREFYALMEDDEFVAFLNDHLLERSNGTIRFLGAAENSVRNLYSKTGPIRLPSDLRSIKLRVPPGPLNISLWESLGVGSVVGLSGSERNQALQTGIIDAVEGSLSGAMGAGHLDILPYVTITGHGYSYMTHIINEDFYQSLSEDHRAIVEFATDISIRVQNGAAVIEELEALQSLEAPKNTVTILSPTELRAWQDLARPVGEAFIAERLDADFAERVNAALDATRGRFTN